MAGRSLTASVSALLLLVAAALLAPPARADRQPMLMEGKHTLFQKVADPAGDRSARRAGSRCPGPRGGPAGFSLFYVYDRKDVGGKPWVEVGRTRDGSKTGWLPADATIDWKQTIVAAFSNPAGRERTLLFDTRQGLIDLLESENVVPRAAELRQEAIAHRCHRIPGSSRSSPRPTSTSPSTSTCCRSCSSRTPTWRAAFATRSSRSPRYRSASTRCRRRGRAARSCSRSSRPGSCS